MARSSSSQRWLREHHKDHYVLDARSAGYRSRAAYKLLEIHKKHTLIRRGQTVVDLGAAPGSWSQVASQHVGPQGRVYALDILPMDPISQVVFIQGDFQEDDALTDLRDTIGRQPVGLVISDMAPNMSGIKAVDQLRAMYLAELALDFAAEILDRNGGLLVKLFQGEGFDALVQRLRGSYRSVSMEKPDASRGRSPEVYALACNLRR